MKSLVLFLAVIALFTGCASTETPEASQKQSAQSRVQPPTHAEDKNGNNNTRVTELDARWSKYGAYLQRLKDTVQIEFDSITEHSGIYPPTGTVVTIKFRLNKTGAVTEIISVESSNGSEQAKSICKYAIISKSPYAKWTDDMVATLGDSQEINWKFYFGSP